MENKVNLNSKKVRENSKKFNINISSKGNLKDKLVNFYVENIMKLHMIFTIITVIFFVFSLFYNFGALKANDYKVASNITVPGFIETLRQNALLDFIVILAGMTPFCFLSVLGVAQASVNASNLIACKVLGKGFLITLILGGLIQTVGIALCVATGIYYCKLTTKKNKYYHQSTFGINDIKQQFYRIRKDKKKVEEIEAKKIEKAKKIEECNVKIPYLYFLLLGLVAYGIQFIGVVIAKI